jgi:hypothetical protein
MRVFISLKASPWSRGYAVIAVSAIQAQCLTSCEPWGCTIHFSITEDILLIRRSFSDVMNAYWIVNGAAAGAQKRSKASITSHRAILSQTMRVVVPSSTVSKHKP